MKLALYSDLHLDLMLRRGPVDLPHQEVDAVILAGDIGKHTHGLDWAANIFSDWPNSPPVIYVTGNHEYYDAHLGLLAELRKPAWKEWGVHFLERDTWEAPGVRILGCTLWSDFEFYGSDRALLAMNRAKQGINDYWLILARGGNPLTPMDTQALHRKAVAWLDAELTKPFDGKTIVVTHFAPHRRCVDPKYEGSDLTPYFVSDLSWLMEKHKIDLWCHGHTHTSTDFIAENGCRVISNQLGYKGEDDTGFLADLMIEI
jgi:predicted phosphodiesterase